MTNGTAHVTGVVATGSALRSAPAGPSIGTLAVGDPVPVTAIDLTPPRLDISGVRAGDRNQVQMTLSSDGTPVNLTGLTLSAQARLTPVDAVALSAVITVTDAPNGVFLLRWDGDEVRTMLDGATTWSGVWDLQLGDETDDTAQTILAGTFKIDMDVTKEP